MVKTPSANPVSRSRALGLLVCIALGLCMGVPALANAAKPRIAVSLQGLTFEFMQLWLAGAKKHPAVASGAVELTVFDGKGDALTQANQIDTIITQKFDAVIFVPVDAEAGNAPAARVRAAKIPLIGSNTQVSDKSVYDGFVGSNDVVAGELVARTVGDKLGGKGAVVILEGMNGQSAQLQRAQGIQNYLAANPGIKVLAKKTANWSRAEALALMENWLTTWPGTIKGVIAHNDEMAIGALQALKARGINPKTVPVAGIDGIQDALNGVKSGEMYTTLQDAVGQAQGSMDLALRKIKGASYQPQAGLWKAWAGQVDWAGGTQTSYMIPWVTVTGSNVDDLLRMRR